MIETIRKFFAKPILSASEKWLMTFFLVLLFIALFWDDAVLKFTGAIRIYPLDALMLFITDFGMLFAVIVLLAYLIIKKKFQDVWLIMLTSAMALEISYLTKVIFQTPRPFAAAMVATIPLTQASGFSMPSLHTAFCFSIWPFLHRIFPQKKFQYLGAAIIITIAFSRLYLGVHYLSDLIAGGMIGYFVAKFWIYLEEEHRLLEWFTFHIKDKLELRRQVAHLLTGSIIVFLLKLQLLNQEILIGILVIGGILSLVIRKYRIAVVDKMLLFFERPEDLKRFPGKGSFYLVLGALLSLMFFKTDIALAAITIMAVGDAITTIIGTYFGRIKNPINPRKHLEGTALAIIVSTFAAFFFVDFSTAFWASVVGMIFESITVRFISQVIDDNVIIPLVSGITMTLLLR